MTGRATWFKSSFCGDAGCVEIMVSGDGVAVRDSKDTTRSPILNFTGDEWRAFVSGVKNGEFDLA